MNTLLKVLAIGGGGLLLVWNLLANDEAEPAPYVPLPGQPAQPPVNTMPPATTTPATPPAAVGNPDPMRAAVDASYARQIGNTLMLTADQWNWYRTEASGILQTADLFNPANRNELISAETYHSRRAAAGLQGLRMLAWGR